MSKRRRNACRSRSMWGLGGVGARPPSSIGPSVVPFHKIKGNGRKSWDRGALLVGAAA
ncbi:hypothetical protein OG596_33405 [Streptomyces sp. NBC_01102]|uniref:hypothetical protein n=1 Tax=unclassified Streptomyces TaxID=2593676 RepID=UPI0038676863|nr:hypothetical protein OG596_33405 [Streptomyces sp. NBC_01102]